MQNNIVALHYSSQIVCTDCTLPYVQYCGLLSVQSSTRISVMYREDSNQKYFRNLNRLNQVQHEVLTAGIEGSEYLSVHLLKIERIISRRAREKNTDLVLLSVCVAASGPYSDSPRHAGINTCPSHPYTSTISHFKHEQSRSSFGADIAQRHEQAIAETTHQ